MFRARQLFRATEHLSDVLHITLAAPFGLALLLAIAMPVLYRLV